MTQNNFKRIFTYSVVFTFFIILFQGNTQINKVYLSPETLIANKSGNLVFIALKEANRILIFDVQSSRIVQEISVPQSPSGLVHSPTKSKLYVTGGIGNGVMYEIDLGSGKISNQTYVGHSPSVPAISTDGNLLYVPNRFDNNIAVVDLVKNIVVKYIPVQREPIVAAITNDGAFLFVAHLIPASSSDIEYVAATVSVIKTSDNTVIHRILLPNGSTGLRGLAISKDGHYLYVTHQIGFYNLPTNQLERGWMNTNVLTIIDVKHQKIINSILLDDLDKGAANPWGVTVSEDGAYIVITHAGTNEISLIDRNALHAKLEAITNRNAEPVTAFTTSTEDVPYDFSFLVGLRQRILLKGKGPRGITIADGFIFVAEYYSGSLGIINLSDLRHVQSKPLGYEPEMNAARYGEQLFNDATKCFQSWQSCASCHPDGRTDGLNWDLMNDGIGNPKNVKSLLLSHQTPPVMGHGIRANAEAAVRSGFKYILFSQILEEDAVAVDEYLKSIEPIPSPYLNKGKLTKNARRGKALFEKAGCINCHSGLYYTNMKSYDVGTLRRWNATMNSNLLDVPSLIEVWRTAPYLHDGRTMSVEEAFISCHPEGVKSLSSEDIKALAEYVLSL